MGPPSIAQKLDHDAHETDDGSGHPDTRPPFVHRSVSNVTVPGIEIVTPVSKYYFSRSFILLIDMLVSLVTLRRLVQGRPLSTQSFLRPKAPIH